MRRRDLLIGGAATLALGGSATAQRVVGIPPLNKYANPINWTLDPAIHPIVSPPPRAGTLFGLHCGQSNDSQYADGVYTPLHGDHQFQFLYSDGTLRAFVEPVFGPSTSALVGSWFGRFGDLMIDSGACADFIHCFTALGGTLASDWGPGGKYHPILTTAFFRMLDAGLMPDFVAVSHGETDCFKELDGTAWLANWRAIIQVARNMGITSPWFFARETFNAGVTSSAVRAAQAAIVDPGNGIYAGPDLDQFGAAYRWDTPPTHFSQAVGCPAVASAWASSVLAVL